MPDYMSLIFTAPSQVEVRTAPLPPLQDDEVLVETICSAVSAGTEMLVYRGEFSQLHDINDTVSSELKYPLAYGYACVGVVRETGKKVDKSWLGKSVFAFQPHTSSFIAHPSSLIPLPHSLPPQNACFLPNMETAVNLVQDGAPILGECVMVLGQGVVGLLTASLLAEFPLENLTVVDSIELRRNAINEVEGDVLTGGAVPKGQRLKVKSLSPADLRLSTFDSFDLVYELTGSPAALNTAIEHTAFSGRIVVGSWYGQKRAEIDFGGSFHRSRIKLISSQVSTISPELSGRWDKPRRFEVAWQALERIQPRRWITHRFSLNEAARAYQLLDENPQETIQVIFEY